MLDCPNFITFVNSNFVIRDDEPQVDTLCLFNDKVSFPRLMALEVKGCGKWKKIWPDKLTPDSFGYFKFFKLDQCRGFSSIFPSSMVDRLQELESLEISHCDDLESIIEPPRLSSIESSSKFVFSKVRWMKLKSLSQLKSFYPSMHTTEWPSLEKLRVTGCSNAKIFALESPNSQLDHVPVGAKQPLFGFSKEAFPCLEKLKTDQDEAKEILELANYQGVQFIEEEDDDDDVYFDDYFDDFNDSLLRCTVDDIIYRGRRRKMK
ncbi:disease resistance protein [Corchorus capsularis]|uniref:Disease resistance protein n=1 Tax=Corchorus capsularis TaxID=210143 RepID=A0A1R3GWN8_COCAP|nr:disease resistance protein [Corchorus capsularis]